MQEHPDESPATSHDPLVAMATGVALWRYLGKPWQHFVSFSFAD